MIPLITIEGPTASGKTALAIELARELGSQIISADSRQVYRHLDIGTAKPSEEELKAVPHHLIGIIDPDEGYNAGRFRADAGKMIQELHSQGVVPIVCGGTGLYVSALLKGLFPQLEIPTAIRERLARRCADEGLAVLYAELRKIDPLFAAGISPNDKQRIQRGLEVYLATGTPISEHWRNQAPKQEYGAFRILIDPPREDIYARINLRIRAMADRGWLDEIRRLLALGYDATAPGLNSLGYKELLPHLLQGRELDECLLLAAQHTRNYAKRQCTWYRKCKFDLTLRSNACIISEVMGLIKAHIH
ncbi:MAG: tRNA (adenosine(37)-N6)-dimethylallyltransferase MiaA [Candidatus Syntrophosphaera sp.]|nr:tRNA (adenosine(37)-N6)-dimethylallyltransferase MiaA [Candidatus Syntrophosphaera sp.]